MDEWKLKYSYAGDTEHALIYTSEYNGFEVVKEIATKKKHGKFDKQQIIYYASELKPNFDTWQELKNFLHNVVKMEE